MNRFFPIFLPEDSYVWILSSEALTWEDTKHFVSESHSVMIQLLKITYYIQPKYWAYLNYTMNNRNLSSLKKKVHANRLSVRKGKYQVKYSESENADI
jgi:hypothetical protein